MAAAPSAPIRRPPWTACTPAAAAELEEVAAAVLELDEVTSDEVVVALAEVVSPVALAVEFTRTTPVPAATPRVPLPAGKKVAVELGKRVVVLDATEEELTA